MSAYAETAAEIAAIAASRPPEDYLGELVAESERLLWELEEMNAAGQRTLPAALAERITTLSHRACGGHLPENHPARRRTQAALDHVFDDIKPALLERDRKAHGRKRVYDDEPDEESEP